jgi:uncharacterized protein involved in exopolysaccharide biosynthesis
VNSSDPIPTNREDAIDIASLWRVVRKAKYLILLSSVICGLLAIAYALIATPIYRAEVVITEAPNDKDMGGGSSLGNQLGGLASLAGLDMANNPQEHEAQGVLNSRRLIEEFIKREGILPVLVSNKKKTGTMWFAVKRFKDRIVTIREDKRTNLTTVGIDWTDAKMAAEWANGFVALCNEIVRTRALNDSTRNIAYLTQQISQTNVVDMQRIIYNIIESEMRTVMLANGRAEYAFTVIDPAVPPELRKSPQRVIVVLVGFALGLMIGIMIAFMRERLKSSNIP